MIAIETVTDGGDWAGGGREGRLGELAQAAASAALAEVPDAPGEPLCATLLLTDDAAVRDLNRRWRGQDKATNVLSFPSDAPAMPGEARAIGDIAMGYETVAREAEADGKTLDAHMAHLVVHAVLHLFGHDHLDPGEADAMEAREVAALARIGIADPYHDSVPDAAPVRAA